MKYVGGYDVLLDGKPSDDIAKHSEPDVLHLPLFSRCLDYSVLQVENGDSVKQGQILATDPVNYFVPLLAPLDGTVNLECFERHITLENLSGEANGTAVTEGIDPDNGRQTLLRLGVWPFITEVNSGNIPDPENAPETVIISLSRFEPFFPNPDVFLVDNAEPFSRGLVQLHRALDGPTIYLVIPEGMSAVGSQLVASVKDRGDWLKLIEVPEKYPNENPVLIARKLELETDSTWTLDAQAVLAVDQALNHSRPNVTRIVSVGGPAASNPAHFQIPVGYPLTSLTGFGSEDETVRIVDGGVLTGRSLDNGQQGLDAECVALTVLQENTDFEVLAFAQTGFGKNSYTRTFASVFKPLFREKYTTALRGEVRPCIFCGNCEDVCPAELIPHLIYRYLNKDRIEDACRVGLDQCIECGLCSYVCTSKIEHLKVFREERGKCEDEKDSRE